MKKKYIAPQIDVLTTATEGPLLSETNWGLRKDDGTTDTSTEGPGKVQEGDLPPGVFPTAKSNNWALNDNLNDGLNDWLSDSYN